jgi:hypothetical protein
MKTLICVAVNCGGGAINKYGDNGLTMKTLICVAVNYGGGAINKYGDNGFIKYGHIEACIKH